MSMKAPPSVLAKTITTPIILIVVLLVFAVIGELAGSGPLARTVTELFIRVVLVAGLYIFIGNSGVISFGHVGFMCLGAYAAAWFTVDPNMKQLTLPGLPAWVLKAQLSFLVSAFLSVLFVAVIAILVGLVLMRLSGIAASIATFAFLAIVNTIYSSWESVTAATSSVVGIPLVTGPWIALAGAALAIFIAYFYAISRSGLALRSARDEPIAARASGVDIYRERLVSFVISAIVCAMAGVLYAHFLGVVNPDAFYLGLTFVSLSMLVVGGMGSLSGAVLGVVIISTVIQILRWMETGVDVAGTTISLPNGIQEIVIGIVMIFILMLRPAGLIGNREVSLKVLAPSNWRRSEESKISRDSAS